jgi:hypothetical protein
MHRIGFSTGAVARGDFRAAIALLRTRSIPAVELSALRIAELEPLLAALPSLDLSGFAFVSIHAPSKFASGEETGVVDRLAHPSLQDYPVVVHPDTIRNPVLWSRLGSRLLIENMDKRKPIGRTVSELHEYFSQLPLARFCFDVGHARQVDPSLTEARLLLRAFGSRLAEIHISEVNTASRHDPISANAVRAFSTILHAVSPEIPIIIESLIDQGQSDIFTEVRRARQCLAPLAALAG